MKFSKAEIEAVIAAAPRLNIPFNKLVLSATHQARPNKSTSTLSIAELAASIKACGVLQNLIVVKGPRGQYEVCAGGRRLEALTLLVTSGDIPDNYPVPVLVVPVENALMASLIENVHRVALGVADELACFTRLIDEGKSIEDVAATFGITPLVVKRRLKLAAVSPKLMELFRQEEIGLDCLMALASVDDHAKQEQAWANVPAWNRNPDHLRRLLSQDEIESDRDPVAKYVTVQAYEKAGGLTRRDLFSDDDKKVYLLDKPLLEKLATDKLQKKAKQIGAGWKWVEVRARYVYDEFVKYGELRKSRREPTKAEAAQMAELQGEVDGLHGQMEALADEEGDEEAYFKLEKEAEALEAKLNALEESLAVWPEELMKQAGCVLSVGNTGALTVKYGLVRPEDRADMVQAARQAEKGSDGPSLVSLPSPKTRPVHSEKLMRRLTAHRVAAVQAELMDRPDVAVAAITAHLASKLLQEGSQLYRRPADALTVNARDTHDELRREAEDMADSAAWRKVDDERQAWLERLPRAADAVFPWLLRQEPATITQLLTFLVVCSVTGVSGVEHDKQSTDSLALALGLDMTKWWSATSASYLSHISKERILQVVTEAAGANAASPLASLKKDAVVAGAEQSLAGQGWLPACLRTRETPLTAEDDDASFGEEAEEECDEAVTT